MQRYSRATTLFYDVPLALLPSKAREIDQFWQSKLAGSITAWEDRTEPFAIRRIRADELDLLGVDDDGDDRETKRQGSIAVIPVYGVISQRMNMVQAMSGGTSTQMLADAFREAMNDDDIRAIVFDIDSPGGSSYGVGELAAEILASRGRKPILSIANSVEASAAYWIGSAADYNYASPGSLVGSVGVYVMHQDFSGALASEGIKTTFVKAGRNKTRGNPYEPLSTDDASYLQKLVDDTYKQFVRAVASGRRASLQTVRERYGEGDVLTPEDALAAGMIDGIKTFDEVLAIASQSRPRQPGRLMRAAEAVSIAPAANAELPSSGVADESEDGEPLSDWQAEQEREAGLKRLGKMRLALLNLAVADNAALEV